MYQLNFLSINIKYDFLIIFESNKIFSMLLRDVKLVTPTVYYNRYILPFTLSIILRNNNIVYHN